MNYMVMECHTAYAVVLSDDGRFLKVANMRYEVGQTVSHIVEMQLPESQPQPVNKNSRRWISTVTALAACLMLAFTGLFLHNVPYASVYMAINPEVRIDVSRTDTVVSVEGINSDGMDLLTGYEYQRKDLDLVMDELVDRAIDMGYLHEGGKITLTLDAGADWVIRHETSLSQNLNEHLNGKISVDIDTNPQRPVPPSTSGGHTVDIPLVPSGDSHYDEVPDWTVPGINSDSAYGDSLYGDIPTDGENSGDDTPAEDSQPNHGTSDDVQSDYGSSDDAQSDYGSSDDAQSDYGSSDDAQSNYGSSDNAQSDYGSSDDAQSNYGSSDDAQSDYGSSDDAQSNYGSSDDAQSDYGSSDDAQSNYGSSDDAQSDYGSSDDAQSNYGDSAYGNSAYGS